MWIFIHQPRPEERAPERSSKDARVSKDGTSEIVPAAILRDGRAKSAASSG